MKHLLFIALAVFCYCGNAQIRLINGDLDTDKDVDVKDITLLVDDVLNGRQSYYIIDPLQVDNSKIIGTWYCSQNEYITFNEDGTSNYCTGATYKYQPQLSRILVYNSKSILANVFTIYEIENDHLVMSKFGDSMFKYYYSTLQAANEVVPSINGYEYVDVGLSVKWATVNVESDVDYKTGGHFAWGETARKTTYSWTTYKYGTASDNITKYCSNSLYGKVDYLVYLEEEDDVASVKWGGGWRMPSLDEMRELANTNNCSWTWTSNYKDSGRAGYIIKSKKSGYTNNSIFLPATGYISGSGTVNSYGTKGYYWTNKSSDSAGIMLDFTSSKVSVGNGSSKCNGLYVRPVHK